MVAAKKKAREGERQHVSVGVGRGGLVLFYTEIRKGSSAMLIGNQSLGTCEGVNPAAVWQQGVVGAENKQFKGPCLCLVCLGINRETHMARMRWGRMTEESGLCPGGFTSFHFTLGRMGSHWSR